MTPSRVRAGARATLGRLPGPHGLGLIPWLVPLFFGLSGAPVATDGPNETAWVIALVTANVAAWITQGAVLLAVRRRALRLSPTPRSGVVMIVLFALIGAIGGVVQALVIARADLPDPPQFTAPLTLILFSTLTWVSTGSIIAFAFSWRDQLADSLRGSEVRAQETRDALSRSTDLEAYRRRVVRRLLRERTLPALVRVDGELREHAATAALTCADALEDLARQDVRTISHLLHPVTRADDLAAALTAVCRPLGVVPTIPDRPPPMDPETIDRASLTTAELLLEQDDAVPRPPLTATFEGTSTATALVISHGRTVRIPVGQPAVTSTAPRPPRWYQIAPAPYGMPWVAIALLNAFSVLVATLAAGSGLWAAAFVDIAVITTGTAALDRLLRLPIVRRASSRAQWFFIGGYVAALGALAGGVWGSLIGGEALSVAILGLVCALGMGLFLPGIRVWSSAIRELRTAAVLDGLAVAATAVRERVRARAATTAAAESLHAAVQSQLLAVAGAFAADTPEDLRRNALSMLDDVTRRSLPAIVAQLASPAGDDEAVLLDASVLASVWPKVAISMRVPDAMPPPALRLFNSVVVEVVGNAVQHGRADAVDVQADLWPGALTITVDDDGSGVAPHMQDGLGLAAIRAIASECSLRPRPAGGTRFEVRLPYLA